MAVDIPQWAVAGLSVIGAVLGAILVREAWAIPAFAVFGGLLGAITGIDLRELRIPNPMSAAAALTAFPLLALATLADIPDTSLTRALGAAFGAFAVYLVLHLVSPGSLGMGDVKLSFAIGAHLGFFGWGPWFQGIFFAFLSMSVIGIALLLLSRAGRKTALPFGPFMVLGAFIALAVFRFVGTGA